MNLTKEDRLLRKFALYVLIDPRNGAVRYVGISSNVKLRIHSHFVNRRWNISKGVMGRYCSWMRELSNAGLKPQMQVVSDGYEYSYDNAVIAEQRLIEAHEDAGSDLLQVSKRRKQLR